VNVAVIARPEKIAQPIQVRLSKLAKQFNVSIVNLVKILERHNIKVDVNPNAKITNEQLSLILNSLTGLDQLDNAQLERTRFQEKYRKGEEIEVRVSGIYPPSQITTLFAENFIGRLSMIDLSWSIPAAQMLFSKIKLNSLIRCKILDVDFESKQVKLSVKHLDKQGSDTILWNRLDRGDVLNAEITEELATTNVILTDEGFYGVINKEFEVENSNGTFKVKIQDKLDSIDLLKVLPASLEIQDDLPQPVAQTNDFGFIEKELRNYESFKRSILGNHACDADSDQLRKYFENNQNLFSKEIEAPFTWHITFEANSSVYETTLKQNAFAYFLNEETYTQESEIELLAKLSQAGYWVRVNPKWGKSEIIEFSLFNENTNFFGEVVISKDQKSVRCVIKNFSFGHSFSHASDAKKRNSKVGAYFLRSPLVITAPDANLSSDESNKKVIDHILEKARAFEIISKLKLEAGEILREEGRTLALIDKFLEYRESLLDTGKSVPLFVDKFNRTSAEGGTLAIHINQSFGDSLEIEEEAVVNIKIVKGGGMSQELVWFSDATLSYDGDKCKLLFYKDLSLSKLENGFYLELKISKAQLQIQRSIIHDFLQKKIKIDHIESLLVQPDKVKPPVISSVDLISQDLRTTEKDYPDNNQIKAVRKAIGNSNIFLIQGPPGTGKTTVITEIINQLVKQGKRILVTGQNHVAVDNVLAKVAKNPSLNLLRVGKEDKIDKDLGNFHIDSLVKEYQTTFGTFLRNQIELIKCYIELVSKGKTIEQIIPFYNDRVNNITGGYGTITEALKQRHFLLLDGISSLDRSELAATAIAFENWINSINTEIDLLIQPLIYGSVDVVFATCIGIKTDPVFRETGLRFDTVIIDEAGKANIAETLVAIELGKEVILVGDQMQLPPYMDSTLIDPNDPKSFPKSEFGYGFLQDEINHALKTSFFEFLIRKINAGEFPKENLEMLNYQHRMHPNIGKFVSESFYGGKVQMGARTSQNRLSYPSPFNKEVVFFDTSNTPNPYEITDGTSAKNNTEADAIAEIILPLLFENHLPVSEIAIIAPYKSQVSNIKRYINNSEKCKYKEIDVSTLDSFQGKEYDVILFSFTRSSNHEQSLREGKKPTKVGFLDDAKRLNVAFSRARKKLILIGNAKTLTDRRSHFDLLFNYTDLFNRLVKLSKDEQIGNFVNIADYKDFKSPFDKIKEKYKEGETVNVSYRASGIKLGKVFGHFFKLDGFDCLLPISLIGNHYRDKYSKLQAGEVTECTIKEINCDTRRVILSPLVVKQMKGIKEIPRKDPTQLWNTHISKIKKGNRINGNIVKRTEFGYFVKLDCGIEGLLHNDKIKRGKQLQVGQQIMVNVIRIDTEKKRIAFSHI
jgi:predicted RNA-binding protein with RPS1 domain/DNA polymerase III delta prime subunit